MHAGESLQLPQEFAVHFLEIKQNLWLGAGVLQSHGEFAIENAEATGFAD